MQVDLKFLPSAITLSSKEIFNLISSKFENSSIEEIKHLIYIEHRNYHFDKPDYIHKNNLADVNNTKSIQDLILNSFEKLNEVFYWRGNKIHVKDECYLDFQNIVTLVPPLSLLAYKLYKDSGQIRNFEDVIDQIFGTSTLPSIYNPYLEDIFKEEKLSELHMHINGTTECDYVWEDALNHPSKFYREFSKAYHKKQVKELFNQIDTDFSPESLFRLLNKAKRVRHYLCQILISQSFEKEQALLKDELDKKNWHSYLNIKSLGLNGEYENIIPTYGHPFSHKYNFKSFLGYEAKFFYDSFEYLSIKENVEFTKLFYFYLLSKSLFHKVIVQQTNQYGFDQFEKITVNEIRELSEKKFFNRFNQLKGMYGQDFEYIEARFAPKNQKEKLRSLVDRIIYDYESFIKQEKQLKKNLPELALVAHFIKASDKRKSEDILTCRDYALRVDLEKRAKLFIDLLKTHPKYTYYIRGIDAAGNELYARPEAFAPAFRYITKRINLLPTDYYLDENTYLLSTSYKHEIEQYLSKTPHLGITYHAGEDFVHVISGIRMVYEAVEFLDMPSKSRIGHATALGICPKLWSNKIGTTLKISKGEWLDNLIFISFFLQGSQSLKDLEFEIKDKIDQYWNEVYNEAPLSLHYLKQIFYCRKIDPQTLSTENNKLHKIDQDEWEYKKILGFNPSKQVLELYKKYHRSEYIKKYKEMIEITVSLEWIELIKYLQKEMIKLLNKRNIAIETMPTSNVRISFYENYGQHHIFNWYSPSDDPNKLRPSLVLASDDPGIFVNHLRAEFSHLYQGAIKKGANPQQTINWLRELNHNAKVFRF